MDYEQKYKESLERAKEWMAGKYGHYVSDTPQEIAEFIFPELKESEDEMIRKAIIEHFAGSHSSMFPYKGFTKEQILAWLEKQNHDGKKWIYEDAYIKERDQLFQDGIDEVLENPQKYGLEKQSKQNLTWSEEDDKRINRIYDFLWKHKRGFSAIIWQIEEDANWLKSIKERVQSKQNEQKSVDKVEPKFKVGDWVVQGCNILRIRCVGDKYYCYETVGGYIDDMLVSEIDSSYHLWTIEDAKNGDVLAGEIDGDNYVLIYKQIKDGGIETYGHYYDSVDRFCIPSQLFCRDVKGTFRPATKEQRELLFAKMKEAGYEWDVNKKELIKL